MEQLSTTSCLRSTHNTGTETSSTVNPNGQPCLPSMEVKVDPQLGIFEWTGGAILRGKMCSGETWTDWSGTCVLLQVYEMSVQLSKETYYVADSK
ncbi:UNVERIFIED_CONTAM: hypothetical protein FKN15_078189 [Acipenser sinensis]